MLIKYSEIQPLSTMLSGPEFEGQKFINRRHTPVESHFQWGRRATFNKAGTDSRRLSK
jgi:hypothetical protein